MKILENALRWVVLTGIFVLPFLVFYVSSSLFFPFITGKNFAFRIIVEVVAAAWLALAMISPEYRPRRSWVWGAFALYTLVLAVADAFGANPLRSFWSNFERMEGWVTIAHLLVYLTVATAVMRTHGLWRNWWLTSVVASVGVGLYGLLQFMGTIAIDQGSVRLDATLGNATYLGIYMLFHVFLAAYFLVHEGWEPWSQLERMLLSIAAAFWALAAIIFTNGLTHGGSALLTQFAFVAIAVALLFVSRKYLLGAIIAFDSFILLFTATRGAILGLVGGAVLAAVVYIILEPRSKMAWRLGVGIISLVIFGGVLVAARDSAIVTKIEPLHRVATISLSGSDFTGRRLNWSMAWQGVKERPILGWGQENYGLVFDKYYNPNMYAQEAWFDRVHEVALDQLVNAGVLGLLAYLAIFLAALLAVWRGTTFSSSEKGIFVGLFAGYFIYLIPTFDNLTSWILFVSVLGFVAARSAEARGSLPLPSTGGLPRAALPLLTLGVILLGGVSVWAINGAGLSANQALIRAVSPQTDLSVNLTTFKQALAIDPPFGKQEIREHLAQGASQIASSSASPELKQQFLDLAATEMTKQASEVPLEARFPLFLGVLLDAYHQYPQAQQALTRAIQLSPKKQGILFELGSNALAQGDTTRALSYFKEAYDAAPGYDEARSMYAALAIQQGQFTLADELVTPLIEKDAAYNSRVVNAYAAAKRFDKIIPIMSAHADKNPTDGQARFSLAAAYYASGDKTHAISVLQQAAKDIPSIADQVRGFISSIENGTAKVQ